MSALRTSSGAPAELLELSGERVVLESLTSAPPGSMLELTVHDEDGAYAIKVTGCRRSEHGYRIEGRLVNVPRERRACLGIHAKPRG